MTVVVLVIIVLCFNYFFLSPRLTSEKNELLSNTYKVLSDESIWKGKMISSDNPSSWNVPIKNIEIKESGAPSNFYCGDKEATFIKYSSYEYKNSIGGWGSVSVVDCGEYYFVYENADSGQKLFGPFERDSQVTNSTTTTLNSTATTSQNNEPVGSEKTTVDVVKKATSSNMAPLKKFIKVSYPNGGETLVLGSTQWIEWTSSDGLNDKVSIEIVEYIPECYANGKYICEHSTSNPIAPRIIADNIPNMGKYNWVVGREFVYGGTLQGGKKYKVVVFGRTADANDYVSDSSDNYFTVVAENLRICPEIKANNMMPTSPSSTSLPSVYFILNGQRRELTEFDLNWVESNCVVKEEVAY